MSSIRAAVIDDHSLFREGVISMLSKSGKIDVVGEGQCAEDAIDIAGRLEPDVMLLDVKMPGGGVEAANLIGRAYPGVRIVMLTVSENGDDVMAAFASGAKGYLLKGIFRDELVGMLEAAYLGETVISPTLGARMLVKLQGAVSLEKLDPENTLSAREMQILDLVSRGFTNKEIGRRLQLTDRTIKNYMTIIMGKLNVRNRVEAALKLRGRDS